jgi:hypothetical protein
MVSAERCDRDTAILANASTVLEATKPGCPSGQREQTVNLPAMPSEVQILLPARRETSLAASASLAQW